MARQAQILTTKGCTDAELADFFQVSERTLNTWKHKHPDFLQSLKDGKSCADDNIERALYERATGYSHPDLHISNFQGSVTVTPTIKRYPPDTTACIFWLKNRRPAEWREKMEINSDTNPEIRIIIGGETK